MAWSALVVIEKGISYRVRRLPVLPDGVNQITNYLLPILETLANAVTAHSPETPPGFGKAADQVIRYAFDLG